MVGKAQASVMWPSAPPPQPQSHHRGVGRRHKRCWLSAARASAQSSDQSSGNLAASDCKYFGVAGGPGSTGSSSQDPASRRRKKKFSGRSKSLGVGNVHVCTHVSLISGVCSQHILQTGQFIMLQMKLGGLDVASRINPNSAVWMKG